MPVSASALDFGYPWWLSYGHLPVDGHLLPSFLLLGYFLKWSRVADARG